jgi:hypothetical protein
MEQEMKAIIFTPALALLASLVACSQSNQQQGSVTPCSPYDPQCRVSQAPGLNNLLPQGSSISEMRQIPVTQ